MRTRVILATAIVAVTSIANAGSTKAVSVRDYPTMEVSPRVRSASYYSAHRSERDLVAMLCMYSRVADGSSRACENVMESAALEIQAVLRPGYGCSGIPVCRGQPVSLIADLPPQIQERVVCSISAAVKYEVPANIVVAVAEKEGGKPGQWVRNTNGTHDVGPMQFNTAYLAELARYGITAKDVAAAGCYSFDLAAWRLRMHIRKDKGDLWTKAANYHSRTPKYNATYRADLMRRAAKWAAWLEAHFVTLDVTKQGASASMPAGAAATVQDVSQAAPEARAKPDNSRRVAARSASLAGYVPRRITAASQQADNDGGTLGVNAVPAAADARGL